MASNKGKWSLWYAIIQRVVRLCVYVYYRPIIVDGKENIPQGEPVIFAGNHQSAFMDALAISVTCGRQPSFLVRADVFRRKLDQRFYNSLKMMPVYRQVDGVDNLQLNEHIFQQCEDILTDRGSIIIFPEGSQNHRRRLRPMMKGIARIAFRTEEKFQFKHGLKIIPVGINFESHTKSRKKLYLRYGKPITISKYLESYQQNSQKAMNELREEIFNGLLKEVIHVDQKDWYYTLCEVSEISKTRIIKELNLQGSKPSKIFEAEQKIGLALTKEKEESYFKQLAIKVEDYKKIMKKAGLPLYGLDLKVNSTSSFGFKLALSVILSPLLLPGILLNILPFWLVAFIVKRRVKDIHFIASVKLMVGLICFGAYYLLMMVAGLILLPDWWWIFPLLILGLLLGIAAWNFVEWFEKEKIRFRLFKFKKQQQEEFNIAKKLKQELEEIVLDSL